MYILEDAEFHYIINEIYKYAKINLTEKKRSLVISRLSKRIRSLHLSGFKDYVEYLKYYDKEHHEFQKMVDAISTNFTSFFREPHHLSFLVENVFPKADAPIKIWSAASSMGQEIYSILIDLKEYERVNKCSLPHKLYASDISRDALIKASRGIYPLKEAEKLSSEILSRYFLKGKGVKADSIKIRKELIKEILFFRMNLTDETYNLPAMDVIFLRNAIIYFDKETKMKLIGRLYHYIKPGGYLILGHSESLSGINDDFKVVGRTIYQKPLQ